MNKQVLDELHQRLAAERADEERKTAAFKARNEAATARRIAEKIAAEEATAARFNQEREAKIAAEEARYLASKRLNYPNASSFAADKARLLQQYRDRQAPQSGPPLIKL